MSYEVRHPGRASGSDKIRYCQSSAYSASGKGPGELHVASGAPPGFHTSSTSASSAPRSSRKYQVGDETRVTPGNSRTCLVIVLIVGASVLVAAAIALGIVFGVINKADSKGTDTPTLETAVSYDASLTLDQQYSSNYDDPASPEYKNLKDQLEPEVNAAVKESDLGTGFIDAQLIGLKRGSIVAIFKFFFWKTTVIIQNENKTLTATFVQSTLKTALNKRTAFVQAQKLLLDRTTVNISTSTGRKDLGETCTKVNECSDSNTLCFESKCTCAPGYYHSNNNIRKGGTCNKEIVYGSSGCTEGRHCETTDAVCLNAQCQCNPSARFHKAENDTCVLKINIDQAGCTENSHCASQGAECVSGSCVCPSNKYHKDGSCVDKIGINKAGCTKNSHCATTSAECRSGACRCPMSQFYKNALCVNKIAIDTAGCTEHLHCETPGAICTTSTCRCPDTHTYKNGRCVNNVDCITWYHESNILADCYGPYAKLISPETSENEKCRHYEFLLGCIKYNSIIDDVECTAAQLHSQFSAHGFNVCPGSSLELLEGLMPDTKSGFCSNGPTAQYFVQYQCLTYDPTVLSSDDYRCKALYTLEGCVLQTLAKDAGCDILDVIELLKKPEVRSGLLDAIPEDCDTRLQLTPCELYAFHSGLTKPQCFYGPTQFLLSTILADVETIYSVNSERKLKCSLYEEAINCLLTSSDSTLQCRSADLAMAMKDAVNMYYDVFKLILPESARPAYKRINFTECDEKIMLDITCESSGALRVKPAFHHERLENFENCEKGVQLPHAEMCPKNHVWDSVTEQTSYIRDTVDNFDPVACKADQDKKCSVFYVEKMKREGCSLPYLKLLFDTKVEKCRHFEAFLGCLKYHIVLLNGEECSFQKLRDLVKSSAVMNPYDICHACDYPWAISDNDGNLKGFVNIHLETEEEKAVISGTAYSLGSDWTGIGISTDNQMSNSDIYTVQPLNATEWGVIDRYASAKSKPAPDTDQGGNSDFSDLTLLNVYGNGIAKFSRRIDTEDTKDVTISGDRYLLFARGPMTPEFDIMKHNFKKVSSLQTFQCSPYTYLESVFPATKQAACTNPLLQRHLWEYDCLIFDFSQIPDADDRCRTEISRRGCVLKIFQESEINCTMDDVATTSQNPQLRSGILDHVDVGCESRLPDTICEKHLFLEGGEKATGCFPPTYDLLNLVYFKSLEEINGYMSADGQKKLKCSLLEELLNCFIGNVPKTAGGDVCTPAQMATAGLRAVHTYYMITFAGKDKPELLFEDCVESVPTEVPTRACPSTAAVADMVVGKCGAVVLKAIAEGGGEICSGKEAFNNCINGFYMPNGDLCDDDHLTNSLEQHANYVKHHLGGFNQTACEENKKCTADFIGKAKYSECRGTYNKLMTTTDEFEKCRHFTNFLGCVKFLGLINGENCSLEELEKLAKENADMDQYSTCKACDHLWIFNASLSGEHAADIAVVVFQETDDVMVTMKAYGFQDTKWVGLGISLNGQMAGSDIYTAQIMNGQWVLTDRYASARVKPQPDSDIGGSSDINLISAKIINGNAIIKFTRKVNTGDEKDVTLTQGRQLLFAHGPLQNGNITKHTFKKVSDVKEFECSPYEAYEAGFPKIPGDVCTNPMSHRYNWEYNCLTYDLSYIATDADRCRAELGRQYCVYLHLKDTGCTLEQVAEMSKTPQVRLDLLDHTSPGCESNLDDSRCEKFYYTTGEWGGGCYDPLISFNGYAEASFDSNNEINAINSSNGQKMLKCSLLEEVLRCIMITVPGFDKANDGDTACTLADVASVIEVGVRGYYQVVNQGKVARDIGLQDCHAGVPSTKPVSGCPTKPAVVDLIVGKCLEDILKDIEEDTDPCGTFEKCSQEVHIGGRDLCVEGYIDSAVDEYSAYMKERFGNKFDPSQCPQA